MFKISATRKKKTTAQAMVEFALALPILLLVVYGLIEAGRLLFIYASVVTAARNAARYGSATGDNASGTPYYQDCGGIKAAADSVAFITTFSNIDISYDAGLQANGQPIDFTGTQVGDAKCTQGATPSGISNGWRINVSVSAQYAPIVPLVPFGPFTIKSTSSRTLLNSISIGVTAPAITWTGSGGINLQVTTSSSTYSDTKTAIVFKYLITNTSTSTVTSPKVTATIGGQTITVTCSASSIASGASITCTGSYTPTQADLDNGSISGSASASAILSINGTPSPVVSNTVSTTLYANQQPKLSLAKTASVPAAISGSKISYTYVITNTGNVTLSSITTTDDRLGSVCSKSSLAPQAQVTCTVGYTIQSTDPSTLINTATATATFGTICPASNPCKSNSASATVVTTALYLAVGVPPSVTPVVGQPLPSISYTFSLTNETVQSMPANFNVNATTSKGTSIPTNPNPCSTSSLGKNSTVNCTGSYTITQADIDKGMVTTTATGYGGSGTITSNTVTLSVLVIQTPGLQLTITTDAPTLASGADMPVGQVINYTYTIQNTGNVTLHSFGIADNKVSPVNCSSAATSLAPGAPPTTCSGTYTITQADIDAGSVVDQATVTGLLPSGQSFTASSKGVVITHNAPRLAIKKSANPTALSSAGQVVTYTYTLQNTGNTPLTSPITVTDDKINNAQPFNCSSQNPIDVGGSDTCYATYTIQPIDVTNQSVTNTASAAAMVNNTQTKITSSNTASTTVSVGQLACDPRHTALKTSPFGMTIINESASTTISISQLQIYYNSTTPVGQFINLIQYGGISIWAGASSGSPVVLSIFNGDVTLAPGANKFLGLNFNSNYITNGSEKILVSFAQSGCPVLDSSNTNQLP